MTQTTRMASIGKDADLMTVINDKIAVAVYRSHQDAENAVRDLQKVGFDMKKLSIVGRDYHTEEHVVGYYTTGDRMMAWGNSGAFWGGVWGLFVGGAFFMIPGVGPILMAGPIVVALVGMLEGAFIVGGLSALGGALVSLGMGQDNAVMYETEIAAGKFLLLVHGTPDDIARARGILELSEREEDTAYSESESSAARVVGNVRVTDG